VSAQPPADFGSSIRFTPARVGDVCVLLAPREAPPAAIVARIAALRQQLGGRTVEPLHITCERFTEGGDVGALVARLAQHALRIAPFMVRGASLFRWQPRKEDRPVLKYLVRETPELARARAAVGDAAVAGRMSSAYGGETEYTVTLLRNIADAPLPDAPPCDLFEAAGFLVSRIVGSDRYETVARADFSRR
jgi:hypothetical protein